MQMRRPICFPVSSCCPFICKWLGCCLEREPVWGYICRLRTSVGTGVLLREERTSPLSKLAEQYPQKVPSYRCRRQSCPLGRTLHFPFPLASPSSAPICHWGHFQSIRVFRMYSLREGLGKMSHLDSDLTIKGLPGGSDGKESACNAGDWSSIPGSGRSPGEGNGNPFQYSCLGNSMDRRAWRATVHWVTKSQT